MAGRTADKKRLKVGLALGSGGVRGFAHIGVIKVLKENNIPIDYVVGSSIGAIIGGLYCHGEDIEIIEKDVISLDLKKIASFLDPCIKKGLLHGNKIIDYLKSFVGDVKIEDLKIPFAAVATDYKNGEPVVFERGRLIDAVRASMSVPIAFKPVENQEKIYIDGAFSLPVPVEVVRKMGADIVIAVNLDGNYIFDKQKLKYGDLVMNGLNLLRYQLSKANANDANIVLTPKVTGILWFDMLSTKKAITAGIVSCEEKIELIKKITNKQ